MDDHWDFLDHVSVGVGYGIPKFVIGHSFGGLIAARLCQQRPDFFKGAILVQPFMGFNPPLQK